MNTQLAVDVCWCPEIEKQIRHLDSCPQAIEAAVRRVVHDYVEGWDLVSNQSPIERRRKKRLKERRANERQTFNRPVWVHHAEWLRDSSASEFVLRVVHEVESAQSGIYLVHDLSNLGMGLISDRAPILGPVVLEFDSWRGRPIEIVLDLRWRRRISPQEYRCGGSILGVLIPE